MKTLYLFIVVMLIVQLNFQVSGQADNEPPVTPVFSLLSVQPETGRAELTWQKSTSADAAGYVLYYYTNGEGFALDTIRDPLVTSYVNYGSSAQIRSESYVVAAFDTAGNISPLSNELRSIFVTAELDTCNNRITVGWTSYLSVPKQVTAYRILMSESGGAYTEAGTSEPAVNSFVISDFHTGKQLCFVVRADLEGGFSSSSSKSCLNTDMQIPPAWINADFATVNDNNDVLLSFSVDPDTEISSFILERKGENEIDFSPLATPGYLDGNVTFTDTEADPSKRYQYRLSAINNCLNPVIYSNTASNISLRLILNNDIINLSWNSYRSWKGGVSEYRVSVNTGDGFAHEAVLAPGDTLFAEDYSVIMYEITGSEVCYHVTAKELTNEHGITGESRSNTVCLETIERITVPNAFTPDNNNINDLFAPVLSFIPIEFHLTVSDRKNRLIFETKDYLEQWNGTRNGDVLPEGVYLWYLRVKTPSGKDLSKSGTVTILKERM